MRRVLNYCFIIVLTGLLLAANAAPASAAAKVHAYTEGFENLSTPPATWAIQGHVAISKAGAFQGKACLTLERTRAEHFNPLSVTLNSFPVKPGQWSVQAAMKSNVVSPDLSYNGELSLQILDSAGNVLRTVEVGSCAGKRPWHLFAKLVEIPRGAVAARFSAWMNKTSGTFSIDALKAFYVPINPSAVSDVTAVKFSDKAIGGLFFPKEKLRFALTVDTSHPLVPAARRIVCVLTDYWGAAYSKPINVELHTNRGPVVVNTSAGTELVQPLPGGQRTYTGTLNLTGVPIQEGKYYEIHASVAEPGVAQPFLAHWMFAVLPQAVTNKSPPFSVPFTQRNWDGRIPEDVILTHRLGIRIADLWSGWDPTPPYHSWAPLIDLCKKYHMGALMGAPNREANNGNDPQWTTTALRMGAERFVDKYKNYGVPFAVSLGNEPGPTNDAAARSMIAGYKAVYDGIKSADPKIQVVGTSCGTMDIFFRNGFQKYQDAYDFHDYLSSAGIPETFKIYHEFFKKYPGTAKPIWSTETGLNSEGLSTGRIARTMVRKFALFFGSGGANISWFDLLYPNGGGKTMGGASFNVFHIRYGNYCPKLTAVSYYNLINGICIKKCIDMKDYPDHIVDALLKDDKNRCLQIIWKAKGHQAEFLPLPDVHAVKVIHIDGSMTRLNAHGKGITLNIAAYPLMLLYSGSATTLPAALNAPAISLAARPAPIVKGGSTTIALNLAGVSRDDVTVTAPPFWMVKHASGATWTLTAPAQTSARQARMSVSLNNGAGELYFGIPVKGQLTARLVPQARTNPTSAGLKLLIGNNDITAQTYLWHISIKRQYPMVGGHFDFTHHVPVTAYFGAMNSGRITVPPGSHRQITLAVTGLEPQTIYRVQASIRNSAGQTLLIHRLMAGFVGVPFVSHPIPLNGKLDAAAWTKSPVLHIDKPSQFVSFSKSRHWHGLKDLSGDLRFLWSKKYLYVGVKVTDRVFYNHQSGDNLWAGDGLQFLIDPNRAFTHKTGYYDYSMGVGSKGPQAYCNSSADSVAPVGNVPSIIVSAHRLNPANGDIIYVLAIPWYRLAPFRPGIGQDLGLAMILNDDNGHGHNCYMGWYGGVSSKFISNVGDLVLTR